MLIKQNLFKAGAVLALFIGLSFVAVAREPIIPYNSTTSTYQISDLVHLNELESCVSGAGVSQGTPWTSAGKTFILMNDITGFNKPIGTKSKPFMGTFDGNGKKITVSINATDPTVPGVGVFGNTEGAVIKNLTISGEINYNANAPCVGFGGVVGFGSNTDITNCTNLANITASGHGAMGTGGIAGMLSDGVIEFCANAGNITVLGNLYTGGIVGRYGRSKNYSTSISNCVNIGTIKGIGDVGGIAGRSSAEHISDCANAGWVSAKGGNIGGIIGTVALAGMMQNCLNTGVIQGNANFHSLIGYVSSSYSLSGMISNCYYDNQMSIYNGVYGMADAAAGVQGLSTAELTKPAIKDALGSAWRIFPDEHGMWGAIIPYGQVYSYPFVYSDNWHVSYVAAMPARLSNGNFWMNVSSVIKLDIGYSVKKPTSGNPGGLHFGDNKWKFPTYGSLYWETNGNLTVPTPPSQSVIVSYPTNGVYFINVSNPPNHSSGQSELIAYMDFNGNIYKKTIPIITTGIPFKININEYETYGFETSEVTPNIVTSNAVIDVSSAIEGNLHIAIFDISGAEVMNVVDKNVTAQSQTQVELNNLHNLASGSYMVAVSLGNNVVFKKFIKQ